MFRNAGSEREPVSGSGALMLRDRNRSYPRRYWYSTVSVALRQRPALVETAANALQANGLPPDRIRTERFGPTGT